MHYDPHSMTFADHRLRQFLLALLAAGLLGLGAELVLMEHYEDAWQLTPLVLITANLVVLLWQAARPSWPAIQSIRVLMMALLAAGAIGVFLHYRANMEFQVEMSPGIGGIDLFLKTIRAKVPPPLAPAAMAQLGLLGLLYTYRHPLLTRSHDIGAGQ